MHSVKSSLIILCFIALMGGANAKDSDYQQSGTPSNFKNNSNADQAGIKVISSLIDRGELKQAGKMLASHLARYPADADYLILLARVKWKSADVTGALDTLAVARTHARGYEDIYLIEAGLLRDMESEDSCRRLTALHDDYRLNTRQLNKRQMDRLVFNRKRGINEVQLESQYDELSNGRGTWHAYSVANKYNGCTGNSLYAGLNTVERYNITDTEGFVGGGIQTGNISIEMEYRKSQQRDVLARNAWSTILGFDTGLSANVMLLASGKEYAEIDSDSIGLGLDYYFANYQLTWMGEKTNYVRNNERLDSSVSQRYYLAYYFDVREYIRLGYITGKELDNDGSVNPPYSAVRTVLLTTFIPLSSKIGLMMELKRHHQSGYYEQNGIRLAFSFKYQ